VKEVILPGNFEDFDGNETLCLAFERGKNKDLSYTAEKRIDLNDHDEIISNFDKESFLAEVTLHRDNKNGVFRVGFHLFAYQIISLNFSPFVT
jgi:hypothetical protein